MGDQLYIEGKDYLQDDIQKISDHLKNVCLLESFGFQKMEPAGEHWVSISSPEFTAICPFSDYPDFGEVSIEYVPDEKCLELKSFKMYINAFRNIKIFHESVTELIFHDFIKAINPLKARIVVNMNVRGNVKTVCKKFYNCN